VRSVTIPWWPSRERERARPTEPASRERVVEVALELLRVGGLDALSMRKVAAELGVSVSTVYWWAGNKEQLLALVVDEIHGRIRLPEVCGNICFGGPKRNRLFMVASQSLYAVYTNTQGASPG